MKTYVSQVYIEQDAFFPFSHAFQVWIHHCLSEMILGWGKSEARFENHDLLFNLSSTKSIITREVYGPSVDKKGKTVEYTVFVPFGLFGTGGENGVRNVMTCLMDAIFSVVDDLGVETTYTHEDFAKVTELVLGKEGMIDQV